MAPVMPLWDGPPRSLMEVAVREADRHKWLVSERLGRDGGAPALSEWWERYFPDFCRHRRLEHLSGRCKWSEFEEAAFACFFDLVVTGDLLLDRILDRVNGGWENLRFVLWINEWGLPRERAIKILTAIDINSLRRDDPGA